MFRSTTAMREIRQCSARERIRSSSNSRFANVPDASRVENARAVSSRSDSPSSAQYIRTTSSAGISATSAAKSICKAHSRALRREPIKYYQNTGVIHRLHRFFLLCNLRNLWITSVASLECFLIKIYQLNRRHGGFKPFVPEFHTRTIERLIDRVRCNDSEYDRQSARQTCM